MLQGLGREGSDLIAEFPSGATYRYLGAAEHFDALVNAESVGREFNERIKRGGYQYTRIR
jgi:hypothetical protein